MVTSTPCGIGDIKIQGKRDIIPQEKHLKRDWVSTKTNKKAVRKHWRDVKWRDGIM